MKRNFNSENIKCQYCSFVRFYKKYNLYFLHEEVLFSRATNIDLTLCSEGKIYYYNFFLINILYIILKIFYKLTLSGEASVN